MEKWLLWCLDKIGNTHSRTALRLSLLPKGIGEEIACRAVVGHMKAGNRDRWNYWLAVRREMITLRLDGTSRTICSAPYNSHLASIRTRVHAEVFNG